MFLENFSASSTARNDIHVGEPLVLPQIHKVLDAHQKITTKKILCTNELQGFPGGSVVQNPPANAGEDPTCHRVAKTVLHTIAHVL